MNTRTLALALGLFFFNAQATIVAAPDEPQSIAVQSDVITSAVEYIHKTLEVDGQHYNWTIMIPPSAQRGGPGLLFLHGIGSSGDDGKLHIKYGLPPAIEKDPEAWPFIVIIPQKESTSDWDFHESAIMQMLDQAIEEGFVDQDRIGITGLSQGGHGALVFASNHSDRFVAAAPVCGYPHVAFDKEGKSTPFPSIAEFQSSMLSIAKNIKEIPVWLFHGEVDPVVPVVCSRVLNQTLKSFEADVTYTEFPGVDHGCWDAAYAKKELGEWFTEHLKE